MSKYTIKNGEFFTYDPGQDELYQKRIQEDGHIAATKADAAALMQTPITLESLKVAITQKRWDVETGSITLLSGIQVATTIGDQNRITSVVANAERSGLGEFDFKAESGWVRVTLGELQGIATAIAQHVQQCFSAERAHHEAIDSLEAAHAGNQEALQQALQAYDIEQGWPSVVLN